MAIDIYSSRWEPHVKKTIMEYFIDSAADVPNLPLTDTIGATSVALDKSTGDVWVLGANGWGIL